MVVRQVTAMLYTIEWVYVISYEMMRIKNNTEFNDANSSKRKIKILPSKTCYMIVQQSVLITLYCCSKTCEEMHMLSFKVMVEQAPDHCV